MANIDMVICCAPPGEAENLGIKVGNTFNPNNNQFGGKRRKPYIKGCLPVLISGIRQNGKRLMIHEMLYFVDGLEKIHLSKNILTSLGPTSEELPETTYTNNNNLVLDNPTQDDDMSPECPRKIDFRPFPVDRTR